MDPTTIPKHVVKLIFLFPTGVFIGLTIQFSADYILTWLPHVT